MTHRPYTSPAWQAKPLADGRVTLLVVPIRPARGYQSTWLSPEILQAAPSCYLIENNGRLGTQMQHPKANQDSPMSPLTWVPLLYAPGDLIWCREAWLHLCHSTDELKYWLSFDPPETSFGPFYASEYDWVAGARSPVTMPKWAARTWFRCTGVEVRRVKTISEDEEFQTGVVQPNTPFAAWRDAFPAAFPNFAANPWAAFVAVEKISKEDV